MKLDNVRPERWNIMCSSRKNIIIASFNFLIFINYFQFIFHKFEFLIQNYLSVRLRINKTNQKLQKLEINEINQYQALMGLLK